MKTVLKYVLPRLAWFKLFYGQWFKNLEGIKAFAVQVMNWLMQETMALAQRLKNRNRKLVEGIKTAQAKLEKMYKHPTVDADEWDEVKSKIGKLAFAIFIITVAETVFNYFGLMTILAQDGWAWLTVRAIFALAVTMGGIYIFTMLIQCLLNRPKYKQVERRPRDWGGIILWSVLCISYEVGIYYLCKIRGEALEGALGNVITNNFVIITGMLLPAIAGAIAAERLLYLSAYKNTLRIAKEERGIAKMQLRIAAHEQHMEDHFKRQVERKWALFEEFKTYKENYNFKNGIETESLVGHFAVDHDNFRKEARNRYAKKMQEIERGLDIKTNQLILDMPLN